MSKSTQSVYDVSMSSVLEALNAPDQAIRHLIEEYGATQADLRDIGLTDYKARKWDHSTPSRPLARTEAVQVPPIGLPETAALVPMNDEFGRRYLRHGVYIHLRKLSRQIRLRATHLGYSDNGRAEVIHPIMRRWRIGSGAAVATLPIVNVAAITAEPDLESTWDSESILLELGPPVTIGLPLGFRPTPGAAAIPGVLHYLVADLLNAAKAGGTLVGTPTI